MRKHPRSIRVDADFSEQIDRSTEYIFFGPQVNYYSLNSPHIYWRLTSNEADEVPAPSRPLPLKPNQDL